MQEEPSQVWHGTTIIAVRKDAHVTLAGDGQVSMGNTVVKSNAKKLRRLAGGTVLAGFAGATADAFALFDRLEGKLEQYPGQLTRACVELAKDWRTDRYLRRLEAIMAVADKTVSLIVSGTGDVLEPEDGHRLGWELRPRRGARHDRYSRARFRGHRPQVDRHRRIDLCFHQRQNHR